MKFYRKRQRTKPLLIGGAVPIDGKNRILMHKVEQARIDKRPRRYTTIYIIKHSEMGVYKIGLSSNLNARLRQLEKDYGPLELVHTICSETRDLEILLHIVFKWDRAVDVEHKSREWFDLDESDIEWLKSLQFIGELGDSAMRSIERYKKRWGVR